MSGLPGGAPLHPRYTNRGMIIIAIVTIICTGLLICAFRQAVKDIDDGTKQTERQ